MGSTCPSDRREARLLGNADCNFSIGQTESRLLVVTDLSECARAMQRSSDLPLYRLDFFWRGFRQTSFMRTEGLVSQAAAGRMCCRLFSHEELAEPRPWLPLSPQPRPGLTRFSALIRRSRDRPVSPPGPLEIVDDLPPPRPPEALGFAAAERVAPGWGAPAT